MGQEQPTPLHSQEVCFRRWISSLVGLPPSVSGVIVALADFLTELQEHGAFPFGNRRKFAGAANSASQPTSVSGGQPAATQPRRSPMRPQIIRRIRSVASSSALSTKVSRTDISCTSPQSEQWI